MSDFHDLDRYERNRRLREWKIRFTWLAVGALVGYGFGMLKL